jgi:signal transduction histidine kinase
LRSIEKFAATGRIARTIAHEVRNPLTNISLATEQLREEVPHNDETDLLLRMIDRNTTRINQLITDLLNSTKFAQLTFTKTSLNCILNEALDLAKDRIELKNIQVNKQYDGLPDVNVDADKMKIAFLNLIMNAVEAMEEGKGILTIVTEKSKDKCIIRIQDNGTGIDEEHMLRIFEPYFTSKAKGSGLGLTNTQNIILNHKGIIYAESEVGKGSTFIVELDCV